MVTIVRNWLCRGMRRPAILRASPESRGSSHDPAPLPSRVRDPGAGHGVRGLGVDLHGHPGRGSGDPALHDGGDPLSFRGHPVLLLVAAPNPRTADPDDVAARGRSRAVDAGRREWARDAGRADGSLGDRGSADHHGPALDGVARRGGLPAGPAHGSGDARSDPGVQRSGGADAADRGAAECRAGARVRPVAGGVVLLGCRIVAQPPGAASSLQRDGDLDRDDRGRRSHGRDRTGPPGVVGVRPRRRVGASLVGCGVSLVRSWL